MERALSPRSVNLPAKPSLVNPKAKEKVYATPPPKTVLQPPGPNGIPGEKYSMGKELGKGGFAICHEGTLLGRKYGGQIQTFAMKIVRANMGMKKMEEKFRTELQIHSKMRHPNIVQFHRAFTYEENTYVVLELCCNGSVKDMVHKRRSLSLPEVRRYTVQLCGAIKYLHARNVIHRDLKMGNIFLDQNMNVKLGDFGLAAILLTASDVGSVSRRTTMCGTPNYIAPEILERGRKGHDFKVDIWALGVILFALLTGYPPFSDKLQEEIYRKVRNLEYEWPTTGRNEYPPEAKDLVTFLLKTNAEERPEPDQIVTHPFFAMHGGDAIPSAIDPRCFGAKPDWLETSSPRGDVMASHASRIAITALARECGVGRFAGQEEPFPVTGENLGTTIYRELLAEESEGLSPTVPLPPDFLYTSHISPVFVEPVPVPLTVRPARAAPRRLPSHHSTRLLSKSGQDVPSTAPSSLRSSSYPEKGSIAATAEARTLPIRSTRSATYAKHTTEPPAPPRPSTVRPSSANPIPKTLAPAPTPSIPPPSNNPTPLNRAIIGPTEQTTHLPNSHPPAILSTLRTLSTTIHQSLASIPASNPMSKLALARKSASIHARPHVVKWVDYTNKFGIGYILSNGTIGCIFNGTATRPCTCVVVAHAETHFARRGQVGYAPRHQIVPGDGAPVEFLEHRGVEGIERVVVPAREFEIVVGEGGVPERLRHGKEFFGNEKRRLVSLWDKFAKYMTQTLGDGGEKKGVGAEATTHQQQLVSRSSVLSSASCAIRFYQRLGNVGIWALGGDGFQFNFPDHTKLVLYPDGWADFYHLSVNAALWLQKGRVLAKAALEERGVLSFPLGTLLRGQSGGKMFDDLVVANELRRKVEFVAAVVDCWVGNGGLGKMGTRKGEDGGEGEEGMRWEGLKEGGGKEKERLIWVTVGLAGGDGRFEIGVGKKS